jgi:integrase
MSVLPFTPPGDDRQIAQAQIAQVVTHWLDTKEGHSGSQRTRQTYAAILGSFREHLQQSGRDLDSDEAIISAQVQQWAALGDPAPATYNQRVTIVSSFYRHCHKHRLLPDCPPDLARVDRRKAQRYGDAQPIPQETIRAALAQIDRATLAGKRDYALLLLALTTGRRVAEVAALRWGNCKLTGQTITVTTVRAKGNKTMIDTLSPAAGRALLAWLHAYYGHTLAKQKKDAPLWVSLSTNGTEGRALSETALKAISQARLGVNFHALRHTFARSMEDAGAKVSEIQARLGHESLETTGRYLAALNRAANPHAQALDLMFVAGEEER